MTAMRSRPRVLTVGHSTHAIDIFVDLLNAYAVKQLLDIRTVPRSRHNPQFNCDTLPQALGRGGIEYLHIKELGGLRHARPDSPNGGWRNNSFRGYADYMQTPDFAAGLRLLTDAAAMKQTAIMCAEAVPWRCHRSLIADALLVGGYQVEHIMNVSHSQPHSLTPFAKVQGKTIIYPPGE
jgi:uncharacterized protein (DUF488 family)